jgi:uncharacterized protein (TIGR02996 family)
MTHDEAFLRAILDNPDDDTPRLVYADWLEEQGDPRGEFIRLQCLLARMPYDDPARREAESLSARLFAEVLRRSGRSVRDRAALWSFCRRMMTGGVVEAGVYVEHYAAFCFTGTTPTCVDVSSVAIPSQVVEYVPAAVAHENLSLPLAEIGRMILVATPDPGDQEVLGKLAFILRRDIASVRADRAQLVTAINRYYGPEGGVNSVDCWLGGG